MNQRFITSKEDVQNWIYEGRKNGAIYLIVVCDTFSYEDYPVYVKEGEDVQKILDAYDGENMQKIMEIIKLKKEPARKYCQMTLREDIKAPHRFITEI